eukprot:8352472-Pyramimonas_sp.AAC.1
MFVMRTHSTQGGASSADLVLDHDDNAVVVGSQTGTTFFGVAQLQTPGVEERAFVMKVTANKPRPNTRPRPLRVPVDYRGSRSIVCRWMSFSTLSCWYETTTWIARYD